MVQRNNSRYRQPCRQARDNNAMREVRLARGFEVEDLTSGNAELAHRAWSRPESLEGSDVPFLNEVTVSQNQATSDLGAQWQAAIEARNSGRIAELLDLQPHLSHQMIWIGIVTGRFRRKVSIRFTNVYRPVM